MLLRGQVLLLFQSCYDTQLLTCEHVRVTFGLSLLKLRIIQLEVHQT